MLSNYENSLDLLEYSNKHKLYIKLIKQLNKDFNLANFNFHLSEDSNPIDLKTTLNKAVKDLLIYDSNTYNALLYRVDVSEEALRINKSIDVDSHSEYVTFLILKRVWKKVWFREKYKS